MERGQYIIQMVGLSDGIIKSKKLGRKIDEIANCYPSHNTLIASPDILQLQTCLLSRLAVNRVVQDLVQSRDPADPVNKMK